MTLDEFVKEQTEAIEKFRVYWIKMNLVDPENFPISLPDGQEGLWWEMLQGFPYENDNL